MCEQQRDAFTLVELLVVIAIAAILAAIAFPAFSSVMDNSKSAKCVGNLRGIGVAALAYAADNNGSFPQIDGSPSVWNSGKRWWWSVLYNYGTTNTNAVDVRKVWRCPCITDAEFTPGSGSFIYPAYAAQKPILGFSYVNEASMRVVQIEKPSKVWLFGDAGVPTNSSGASTKYMTSGGLRRYLNSWDNNVQPAYRHSGNTRANFVTCDGHVESISAQDGTETGAFGYKSGNKRIY